MHTAESKCTPRSQNQNLYKSLGAFKGTIRRNPFRGEQFYHVKKDLKKFFLFAKTNIFTTFVIEYLGEIETEVENTLACLSGAQMGLNHEINWRSKIS